jgi:hypothetical protein
VVFTGGNVNTPLLLLLDDVDDAAAIDAGKLAAMTDSLYHANINQSVLSKGSINESKNK